MKKNILGILLFACMGTSTTLVPKTLYFVADDYQFDINHKARDQCTKVFLDLKLKAEQLGYTIKTVKSLDNLTDVEAIIFFDLQSRFCDILSQYSNHKLILYLWESPLHDSYGNNPFHQQKFYKVFSLWSRYVDHIKVLQHFYVQPELAMIPDLVAFEQKKLCVMIVGYKGGSDLYNERFRAVHFFESLDADVFDLYGADWPPRKSYKGAVPHKKDVLKNYRFSICYENSRYEGYITEKIFDCMVAGCVPVYWGAPDVEQYIPAGCFIDRRKFASLDQLYSFLTRMKKEEYEQYLVNIRAFLSSPKAQRYSINYFIDRFFTVINPYYDRSRIFSAEEQVILAGIE